MFQNQKFGVKIEIVPTEGKPNTIYTKVEVSGASLKEVLAAAGIPSEKRDLLVNGKPATLDTHIGPNDTVEAKEVTVQVAERPRGS